MHVEYWSNSFPSLPFPSRDEWEDSAFNLYLNMYLHQSINSTTPDFPCLLHPPSYLLALFVGAAAVPSPPAEAGRAHVPLPHDTEKWDRCHVPPAHGGDDGAFPQASEWLILLWYLWFIIIMIAWWVIDCLDSLTVRTCVICIVFELMWMESPWRFGKCTKVMQFWYGQVCILVILYIYREQIFVYACLWTPLALFYFCNKLYTLWPVKNRMWWKRVIALHLCNDYR